MGKVTFNMTMSLDGLSPGRMTALRKVWGNGGDALFKWYFSGDTEIPISDGNMVLKISPQSAELLRSRSKTMVRAYGAQDL